MTLPKNGIVPYINWFFVDHQKSRPYWEISEVVERFLRQSALRPRRDGTHREQLGGCIEGVAPLVASPLYKYNRWQPYQERRKPGAQFRV